MANPNDFKSVQIIFITHTSTKLTNEAEPTLDHVNEISVYLSIYKTSITNSRNSDYIYLTTGHKTQGPYHHSLGVYLKRKKIDKKITTSLNGSLSHATLNNKTSVDRARVKRTDNPDDDDDNGPLFHHWLHGSNRLSGPLTLLSPLTFTLPIPLRRILSERERCGLRAYTYVHLTNQRKFYQHKWLN